MLLGELNRSSQLRCAEQLRQASTASSRDYKGEPQKGAPSRERRFFGWMPRSRQNRVAMRHPARNRSIRPLSSRLARALASRSNSLLGALTVCLAVSSATACGTGRASQPSNPQSVSPPAWDSRADQSLLLGGGNDCIGWLHRLGIAYQPLPPTRGVQTPVHVTGPIGGIQYTSNGKSGLTADCRLILALDWSARALAPLGVTEIRHSGAYVYRTTRSGRPSLHAKGLALDVHGVQFGQYTHWVEQHYQRGENTACFDDSPALNQFECQLRQLRLFRELITPNHNRDHHDHLHLGISPLD